MGNPFEDTEQDATESAPTTPEVREGDMVVDLTEPVSMAKESDEERQTRAEKKQQRSSERWDERERELRETRDRMSALERELSEIRRVAQPREEPREDPFQSKLDDVYERRRDLAARYSLDSRREGGLSKEERAEYESKAKKLEMEQMELVAARAAVRTRPAQPDPEITAIRAKHYDVVSHPQAAKWAHAALAQAEAEGTTLSPRVVDEVAERARKRFNLGGAREASESERSKYTGAPKSGQVSNREPPNTYRMTKDDKKMADSLYSHIKDDATRYRTWVKEVALASEKE